VGGWVAPWHVSDVLHRAKSGDFQRLLFLPTHISNILLLLSKYLNSCLGKAANALIYNGRLLRAIRIVNNLTNWMQRRQRLALSAQLPAHRAGRRVQRLDPVGVDGVGGKIASEPALQGPVALGEVFEEGRGS